MMLFKQIQDAKPVIRDVRYHIGTAVVFFVTGVFVGLQKPGYFGESFRYLTEMAGYLKNQNILVITAFLFLKNATASFIVLWAGTLLGVVSLGAAVQNGLLMGAVLSRQEAPVLALLSIIPHGIFELPAFFMSCGIGIWRGTWLFRKDRSEPYGQRAKRGYRLFFRVIIPLLVIAAMIEGSLIALAR